MTFPLRFVSFLVVILSISAVAKAHEAASNDRNLRGLSDPIYNAGTPEPTPAPVTVVVGATTPDPTPAPVTVVVGATTPDPTPAPVTVVVGATTPDPTPAPVSEVIALPVIVGSLAPTPAPVSAPLNCEIEEYRCNPSNKFYYCVLDTATGEYVTDCEKHPYDRPGYEPKHCGECNIVE